MSVVHTSRLRIEKHEGPHRTAHLEGFPEPIHFGVHGGIRQFHKDEYGRDMTGHEYPVTLDCVIARGQLPCCGSVRLAVTSGGVLPGACRVPAGRVDCLLPDDSCVLRNRADAARRSQRWKAHGPW
jgi:hypothetical protein